MPSTVPCETIAKFAGGPGSGQNIIDHSISSTHEWEVQVDNITPAEWAEIVDLFDDANLYQTWSYGAVRWGSQNLSHLVLKRNREVVAACQLRIARPTKLNLCVAYLRWGPLCKRRDHPLEPDVVRRVLEAVKQEYASKRKHFVRILPNAFVGSAREAVFEPAFAQTGREARGAGSRYRTFLLDLAPSMEELRKSFDKKWRNALTKSEKNGLQVFGGNTRKEYEIFCRIYNEMMERKAFETTVDIDEFGRIQDDLPEKQRMQTLICTYGDVPVAGIVSSAMGESASYLLGATSDKGMAFKGAYLLQWTLIQDLKRCGIRWYDLGGIDPENNPGVYHFKKGLSGADMSHMNPQTICDSAAVGAIVNSGESMYRTLHGWAKQMRRKRTPKEKA